MRKIKQVDIVTNQGVKSYRLGDMLNGLVIVNFDRYENDGMLEVLALDSDRKRIVEIRNFPIVLEYEEVKA